MFGVSRSFEVSASATFVSGPLYRNWTVFGAGWTPKALRAPPVVAALVGDAGLAGVLDLVRTGANRREALERERVLAFPDVLGQDGQTAPDADRRERLANQVEVRIRRLEVDAHREWIDLLGD